MAAGDLSHYAKHSRWTDPGDLAAHLATLPADPQALPELVGGLVLHPLFAPAGPASSEPGLRRIRDILAAVLAKDDQPLVQARPPEKRVLGTCRNYALLAGAILRQHDVPARLRVGFADYFTSEFWEDHWVCEYHDGSAWHLLDPELSPEVRQRFAISFDPADVPRDRFLAAGPTWQALRCGAQTPARFGVSAIGISGLWFAAGSLLRDLAALDCEETMPWDYWGPARDLRPDIPISADRLILLDALADALVAVDAAAEDAASVTAAYPWAALTPSVLSFPQGQPVEVSLAA